MPGSLLFCMKSKKSVCYSVADNTHVAPDGKVMDVSGGTAIMKDREGYRTISKKWTWGWGQGMALAFFAAVLMSDKRRDI